MWTYLGERVGYWTMHICALPDSSINNWTLISNILGADEEHIHSEWYTAFFRHLSSFIASGDGVTGGRRLAGAPPSTSHFGHRLSDGVPKPAVSFFNEDVEARRHVVL